MQKQRIGFIINPISGTNKKKHIPDLIEENLSKELFLKPDILFTEHKGHAIEIARKLAQQKYDIVVAVGGDGTVNEVAQGLLHTETVLGIIPVGSGNGLARHLGIPMKSTHAIEVINMLQTATIDYGKANEQFFFCTCGTGFDANVSWDFAKSHKRGLNSYIELALKNYINFTPQHYILTNDKIQIEQSAFLITFANAAQYGNNIYIAPQASILDGMMDIAIFSEFPVTALPEITLKLLTRQIDKSIYLNYLQTDKITLNCPEKSLQFHIDGEAVMMETPIDICIIPAGLKVICKNKRKSNNEQNIFVKGLESMKKSLKSI